MEKSGHSGVPSKVSEGLEHGVSKGMLVLRSANTLYRGIVDGTVWGRPGADGCRTVKESRMSGFFFLPPPWIYLSNRTLSN